MLYVFGLKTVHLNSRQVLDELAPEFGQPKNQFEAFDTAKIFGLYRTRESQVIFKDDPKELRIA